MKYFFIIFLFFSFLEGSESFSQPKESLEKREYVKKRKGLSPYSRYLDKFESKKANKYGYKYKFGGQISYDFTCVNEADISYIEKDFRRVSLYHKGDFFNEEFFYELEYSFLGENHYKDILAGYQNSFKSINLDYRLKFGNIKIPFSFETYASSKNITFMERAFTDAFSENRKVGVEFLLSQNIKSAKLNLFSSIFMNSIDEKREHEVEKSGYSLRSTFVNKFRKRYILSFGGGYMSQNIKGDNVKIKQGTESNLMRKKYLSVNIKDVQTLSKVNLEFIYIFDKYYIGGEYTRLKVDAYNKLEYLHDYNYEAYYIEGSYFLRGQGKRFNMQESLFSKVKPKIDGALEIAFRYSFIDLNDISNEKIEAGGEASDYTFGVNWYINQELKILFNYIVSEPRGTEEYDGRLQVFQVRTLFAF